MSLIATYDYKTDKGRDYLIRLRTDCDQWAQRAEEHFEFNCYKFLPQHVNPRRAVYKQADVPAKAANYITRVMSFNPALETATGHPVEIVINGVSYLFHSFRSEWNPFGA